MKSSPSIAQQYLFVYGTLKRGFQNEFSHLLRSNSKWIGEAYIYGKLYDIGNYPGVILSTHQENKVHGEIYRLDHNIEHVLAVLDEYEGVFGSDEGEYVRRIVTSYAHETPLDVWVYIYNYPVEIESRIPSGVYQKIF